MEQRIQKENLMSYNSVEILLYTQKVCKEFNVEIPALETPVTWEEAKQGIMEAAKAFEEAPIGIATNETRQRLFAYLLIAIANAVHFVDKNPGYRTRLDVYIGSALKYAKEFEVLNQIKPPQFYTRETRQTPAVSTAPQEEGEVLSNDQKDAIASRMGEIFYQDANALKPLSEEQERELSELSEVEAFKERPAFVKLCKYQEFLSKDNRTHWFKDKDKAANLGILIQCLDKAKSNDEITHILSDFYAGKGREESLYEKLNRGQGLTSRFMGLFNSNTHTTTLELIDKLAAPFGIGNLVPSAPAPK